MGKDFIKAIQKFLNTQGYDLVVDGILGPKTKAAFQEFFYGERNEKPSTPSLSSILYQGTQKYPVHEFMIHCSATRPEWMFNNTINQQVEEITRWHKARGWRTIGYHYVINRHGHIGKGRGLTEIGAGCEGRNRGVIHVCLLGGHGSASTDSFDKNYTARQMEALKQVYKEVASQTDIRIISGHNDYAAKACPGFDVDDDFIRELKR